MGDGRMSDKRPTALTNNQRVIELDYIYDKALEWLIAAVDERCAKGTGAASMILRATREELIAWKNDGVSQTHQKIEFDIPGVSFGNDVNDIKKEG